MRRLVVAALCTVAAATALPNVTPAHAAVPRGVCSAEVFVIRAVDTVYASGFHVCTPPQGVAFVKAKMCLRRAKRPRVPGTPARWSVLNPCFRGRKLGGAFWAVRTRTLLACPRRGEFLYDVTAQFFLRSVSGRQSRAIRESNILEVKCAS